MLSFLLVVSIACTAVIAQAPEATSLFNNTCFYYPDAQRVMTGGPIMETFNVPELSACEQMCIDKINATPPCKSLNYNYAKDECLLYDRTSQSDPANFQLKSVQNSTYVFREIIPCSTGQCFSPYTDATMIAQGGAINDIPSGATLQQCKDACLPAKLCRSIVFDNKTGECLIYELSPDLKADQFLRPRTSPGDDTKQFLIREDCPTTTSPGQTTQPTTVPGQTTVATTPSNGTTQGPQGPRCGTNPGDSFGPANTTHRFPDSAIKSLVFSVADVAACEQQCLDAATFLCKSMAYFPNEKECALFTMNSQGTRRAKRQSGNFGPAPAGETQEFHDRLIPCPNGTTTGTTLPPGVTTPAPTAGPGATTAMIMGPPCIDAYHQCAFWALNDQCNQNPAFMLTYCKDSCDKCPRPPGSFSPAEQLKWALHNKIPGSMGPSPGQGYGGNQGPSQPQPATGYQQPQPSQGYGTNQGPVQPQPATGYQQPVAPQQWPMGPQPQYGGPPVKPNPSYRI